LTSFWPTVLGRLLASEDLSPEEAGHAMRLIMAGEASTAQLVAFAVALRGKGETAPEVAALAGAMLEAAPVVETPGPAVDTSGTGGDGLGTFNVSTLAAIVAAGAGVLVAKHGNRAVSSRCGSADLLEGLGVNIALGAEGVGRCLGECGIGFMFAPVFHPSLGVLSVPRKEVGAQTVFDFLGPLTNPAGPAGQVVGVSDSRMQSVMAGVYAKRGTRAYVVRGVDGLDEITTTGPTALMDVAGGAILEGHLLPIEVGVRTARLEELVGGDLETNMGVAKSVLAGEKGPAREIVAVNAAAALVVAEVDDQLHEALPRAFESIDSGKASQVLSNWIEISNRV
jgi:anthranilate phosphoribosyltransferase